MTIINKLKNLGRRLVGKPAVDELEVQYNIGPRYPSTSRERKYEARINAKYSHVSMPIIENPLALREQAMKLGLMLPQYTTAGRGQTTNTGSNYIKREADALAERMGWNNKQRRRLRTAMKRRAAELAVG